MDQKFEIRTKNYPIFEFQISKFVEFQQEKIVKIFLSIKAKTGYFQDKGFTARVDPSMAVWHCGASLNTQKIQSSKS